ncbi:type II toxin-antitoxin system RelE/ParE family toxin [Enterobacter sp. WCHEn090032]|uniref:type II toxin-antitoxin system RelE/ParE family toxin n=1 Tax=Enterobacter sp. WCHEn090032 TaxID=2497435 RepID=UPI000F8888D2|nr:type II toxin-antitoxin system RelE/ParE family toxin [Enterobacter sp. WCHEn090032]RTN92525.1 addiction module toxin RelE [Enterobacter sp. WCHEn090032]
MSHAIEFIETSLFTRQIKSIATDDELRELQKELIARPDKGDLIQHTGGLRKIRMSAGSKGKRGGARVIYFLATREVIYFIMAYPKSIKDSLTDAEKAEFKKLTTVLLHTASNVVSERCTMYAIRHEEVGNEYL